MTTAVDSVLEQVDAMLAASDPGDHPLLRAMGEGTLERDDLRAFATQFFHQVDALPRLVSTVHAVTRDADTRRTLLNVLVALELHPPSAADLWLQTSAAIGLFSDTVRASEPTVATSACLGDFEYLCGNGSASGVAALYAWMHRLPATCRVQQSAFATHYGVASGPGVQFFEMAGFQAQSHARALRGALERLVADDEHAADAALQAAASAMTALDGLYSGPLSPAR